MRYNRFQYALVFVSVLLCLFVCFSCLLESKKKIRYKKLESTYVGNMIVLAFVHLVCMCVCKTVNV